MTLPEKNDSLDGAELIELRPTSEDLVRDEPCPVPGCYPCDAPCSYVAAGSMLRHRWHRARAVAALERHRKSS